MTTKNAALGPKLRFAAALAAICAGSIFCIIKFVEPINNAKSEAIVHSDTSTVLKLSYSKIQIAQNNRSYPAQKTFPIISENMCVQYASQYGITTTDARTLLAWLKGGEFHKGDVDKKAFIVGEICAKYRLNYAAISNIIGDDGSSHHDKLSYAYCNYDQIAWRWLEFIFRENGELVRVSVKNIDIPLRPQVD